MSVDRNLAIIVDDEAMIVELFEMECSRLGYETVVCANGQEAYDVYQNRRDQICFILSDVRMPVKDGVWLLQQVRAHSGNRIPFIFMSGFADIALWTAFDIGADAFIGKPFRLESLTETITNITTPVADRWKNRANADDNTLDICFPNKETASGKDGFKVGRGGFYLGSFDDSLRRGQFINYKIGISGAPQSLEGTGLVRWVRYGHAADEIRSAGIEFIFLEEKSRQVVINHLTKVDPAAYIPAFPAIK